MTFNPAKYIDHHAVWNYPCEEIHFLPMVGGEDSLSSSRIVQQGVSFAKETIKPDFFGWRMISLPMRPSCSPINPHKISHQSSSVELLIQLINPWCKIQTRVASLQPLILSRRFTALHVKHPGLQNNTDIPCRKVSLQIIISKCHFPRKVVVLFCKSNNVVQKEIARKKGNWHQWRKRRKCRANREVEKWSIVRERWPTQEGKSRARQGNKDNDRRRKTKQQGLNKTQTIKENY